MPHIAADHRRTFPHGLSHGQAKALAQGFLQNHRGSALQGIHQGGVLHREDNDALLLTFQKGFIYLRTFGVISGHIPQ